MRICIAQTIPVIGDIDQNIAKHLQFINSVKQHEVDCIIFPELSLTGYEPTLADALPLEVNDKRMDSFQKSSDENHVIIGVGIPVKHFPLPQIGMVVFNPQKAREYYIKEFLHNDEWTYFNAGRGSIRYLGSESRVALAICYEISVQTHAQSAYKQGAGIYLASVAKFTDGIHISETRLAEIAVSHNMTVMMSNSAGTADGATCAGRSGIWNNTGELVAQLDDRSEGFIVHDTETQATFCKSLII